MLIRKEAIKKHREMWDRIYKYCNERYDSKTVPNAREIKTIILKEMNGGNMPILCSDCYLCEYVGEEGCQKCPLEWGIRCCAVGGLYNQFVNAKNYKEAAYFALRIRDLRERIERNEREKPMIPKVENMSYGKLYTCPKCGEQFVCENNEEANYCWNCGQRLTEREREEE